MSKFRQRILLVGASGTLGSAIKAELEKERAAVTKFKSASRTVPRQGSISSQSSTTSCTRYRCSPGELFSIHRTIGGRTMQRVLKRLTGNIFEKY